MELAEIKNTGNTQLSIFNSAEAFANAERMAVFLAKSTLVPKDYQNNASNTMIAIDIAQRVGVSPLMVMQNLNIIHGKPSWSSVFIIAALNSCGRFSQVRFQMDGEGDARSCFAYATDREGNKIEGPPASIEMAKKEGWFGKQGSKWQTMPELMLRYRAAAFFGRLYAPDILNGMYTADEVEDFVVPPAKPIQATVTRVETNPVSIDREPGDDGTITTKTLNAIVVEFQRLKLDWTDSIRLHTAKTYNLPPDDLVLEDLTETAGIDMLKKLQMKPTPKE